MYHDMNCDRLHGKVRHRDERCTGRQERRRVTKAMCWVVNWDVPGIKMLSRDGDDFMNACLIST